MTESPLTIEIPSDSTNLILVEEFINQVAFEFKITEDRLPGLLLAVTEATTNAIIHANKKDKSKKVRISAKPESGNLFIIVKDEGKGFDPAAIPDPTAPENLLKDSGRGLYLMRIYSDELSYNQTPTGTETILRIKLNE
ncbi:MAG: ATP-binding protein [Ignavibacteriaceae bacterium]|nr:ATP-binding protein [Ignavibacteriaceae bacterium]